MKENKRQRKDFDRINGIDRKTKTSLTTDEHRLGRQGKQTSSPLQGERLGEGMVETTKELI